MTRVAVVGSGAAGLTVAVELARSGHRVDLFETGRFPSEELLDAPFTEELRRSLMHRFRRPSGDHVLVATPRSQTSGRLGWTSVQVGGGTAVWGGLAYRPPPRDFQLRMTMREWRRRTPSPPLPEGVVDWPLTYGDYLPWLVEAASLLGVQPTDKTLVNWSRHGTPHRAHIRFEPAPLAESGRVRWRASGRTRKVRELWPWRHAVLAARLGVNIRATTRVLSIELDQRGKYARALRYCDSRGRYARTRYEVFFLAAGAIQTVRMLLLSGFDPRFAPSARLVGRYMTFHLFGPRILADGHTGAEQPPMVSWDYHDIPTNAGILPGGFVSLQSSPWPSADWTADAHDERFRCLDLRFTGEDLPFFENGVELAGLRDAHGLPVAQVNRLVIGGSGRVHARMAHAIRDIMAAIGLRIGRSSTFDDDWRRVGDHQMGGCRMGESNENSVTRPDARFHDLANVYAADASTFPTALSVPPTLLVVANALRIARSVQPRPRTELAAQ